MSFLEVQNLSVHYDGVVAVRNVTLSVEKNDVVVLVGANGAGKTSILKALFGLIPHSADRFFVNGKDARNRNTRFLLDLGMALVPETRELFSAMTVEDNLKLGLFLQKKERDFPEKIEKISELFPILKNRLKQRAGTLSGGEQQMLAIARALMQEPHLLCLDEPSLGLAPKLVSELFEMLGRVLEKGTSILLVEQQARRALEFGERGYVLNVGEVVREGSCKELVKDEFVRKVYLGDIS